MAYMKRHLADIEDKLRAALDAGTDKEALEIMRGVAWTDITEVLDSILPPPPTVKEPAVKLLVVQLIAVEDGAVEASMHRTVAAAQDYARQEWGGVIPPQDFSDEELTDWDDFVAAVADYGIDITLDEVTINTDDFDQEEATR